MSDLDLDAIEARATAAMRGPWRWDGNTDTGEPRLSGPGCDVLAIGWDERSKTGRDADAVREFALDSGLDPDQEVDGWAEDRYGQPIREPRLWFFSDLMADPARDHAIYEVAPRAKHRDDPSVYRADITGIRHPDAEFIAHSRTDVPALVARVRELEAAIQRFREHCEYGERTLIANSESTSDNERLARRFEAKASGLRLALSYLDDERAAIDGDRA